jgi:hypothetical protein
MIREFGLTLLTGLICLVAGGNAWATRYFNIYNDSNNGPVVGLWVSPHGQENCGPQVLNHAIASGGHTFIYWDRTQPFEWYDLKLRFANGYVAQWTQHPVNLHLVNSVFINWYDGALHTDWN